MSAIDHAILVSPDLWEKEEEFFRVEGRPEPCASRACAYVARLELTPTGEHVGAAERAALWYLAYWAREAQSRCSARALAMHLDCYERDARRVLMALIDKRVLSLTQPYPVEQWLEQDEWVYEFQELAQ